MIDCSQKEKKKSNKRKKEKTVIEQPTAGISVFFTLNPALLHIDYSLDILFLPSKINSYSVLCVKIYISSCLKK